ncbi:lipopolysaccharide core biosynthesis protein LpsA [unidentified eubacterium SCB49]|nr:lipopolysaccharide core biosynthesis protein LpsA [unidentified eubacterium SCB49]
MELKRISGKHKNSKLLYYLKNYSLLILPRFLFASKVLKNPFFLNKNDEVYINSRVDYYNKIENDIILDESVDSLTDIYKRKRNTYFFDLRQYSRFFRDSNKMSVLFGDITHVPEIPSITKSRPVQVDNYNSVLFKLNKIRHFLFIEDAKQFNDKKNMLVSRGKVHPLQVNRINFLKQYFSHPLCDIGKVNDNELNPDWFVNRMTIEEQLDYKFILSLEGNDVATNLKWVMSSNSIAVMTKPKFETWFMEGTLIPDFHYIKIKDDFSDLEEKLNYYSENVKEALAIINNAHEYVNQFKNKKREDAICFLVLEKYFKMTNQSTSLKK